MQLRTLEECIHDDLSTTAKLDEQISSFLTTEAAVLALPRQLSTSKARQGDIQKALSIERKRLESAIQKRTKLRESHVARRAAMAAARAVQKTSEGHLTEASSSLERCRRDLASTSEAIEAQRRRIVETLTEIFPIEPVNKDGGNGLAFAIRGCYLPSTGHEDADADTTAAALGYVAQIVYSLSFYLYVPLCYPIRYVGSQSFIKDPISVIQGARTFPLWSKGTVLYRFEYGIFLLNKDIEQVSIACPVGRVDSRS